MDAPELQHLQIYFNVGKPDRQMQISVIEQYQYLDVRRERGHGAVGIVAR